MNMKSLTTDLRKGFIPYKISADEHKWHLIYQDKDYLFRRWLPKFLILEKLKCRFFPEAAVNARLIDIYRYIMN